jgi:hypothetical protein
MPPFLSRLVEESPSDVQVYLPFCIVVCTRRNVGVRGDGRKSHLPLEMPSLCRVSLSMSHQPCAELLVSRLESTVVVVTHLHVIHHRPSKVFVVPPLVNISKKKLGKVTYIALHRCVT